jgi:hypothetical protein
MNIASLTTAPPSSLREHAIVLRSVSERAAAVATDVANTSYPFFGGLQVAKQNVHRLTNPVVTLDQAIMSAIADPAVQGRARNVLVGTQDALRGSWDTFLVEAVAAGDSGVVFEGSLRDFKAAIGKFAIKVDAAASQARLAAELLSA